jgi:hypothetical protein
MTETWIRLQTRKRQPSDFVLSLSETNNFDITTISLSLSTKIYSSRWGSNQQARKLLGRFRNDSIDNNNKILI